MTGDAGDNSFQENPSQQNSSQIKQTVQVIGNTGSVIKTKKDVSRGSNSVKHNKLVTGANSSNGGKVNQHNNSMIDASSIITTSGGGSTNNTNNLNSSMKKMVLKSSSSNKNKQHAQINNHNLQSTGGT